ncbi:hypothetical protein CHS0354_019373 [Potamilus streckersoni]|uniref:Uncharacterized protein n=1 Tax=Potamilus streckersoni TaxID=2493646 RepID=A0AAE0SI36_9BIVA|nr:hypothetical protein CHS0354_019373 [Potamilus streckersoni]
MELKQQLQSPLRLASLSSTYEVKSLQSSLNRDFDSENTHVFSSSPTFTVDERMIEVEDVHSAPSWESWTLCGVGDLRVTGAPSSPLPDLPLHQLSMASKRYAVHTLMRV